MEQWTERQKASWRENSVYSLAVQDLNIFPIWGKCQDMGKEAPLPTIKAEEEHRVPLSASWHLVHKYNLRLASKILPYRTLKIREMTQRWKVSEIIHGIVTSVYWQQGQQQQAFTGEQASSSGKEGPGRVTARVP